MKSSGVETMISPGAEGWRVTQEGSAPLKFATLGEAAAALPLKTSVRLALPCEAALIERLKFPATDRAELTGMLQLQLEKTLPFPVDEVSSEFEVIATGENESTLLSVATHRGRLDTLCQPLRERAKLPEKITLFAMHVAAACPDDPVTLAIYPEQGQLVLAICEQGKLSWAQTVPHVTPEALLEELPQLLLTAEMDGVPSAFTVIRLAYDLQELRPALRQYFELPVEYFSLDVTLPEPAGNLVPAAWEADSRRTESAERWQQRFFLAAVFYLLLVAGAFVYLAWLKHEAQKIGREYAAAQPQLLSIQARARRWDELAPAVDPSRYLVEVLHTLHRNLPTAEVNITEFEQKTPAQWQVVGEAPSANLAIEYIEKLKTDAGLEAWQISAPPPKTVANERWQFNVFGRR